MDIIKENFYRNIIKASLKSLLLCYRRNFYKSNVYRFIIVTCLYSRDKAWNKNRIILWKVEIKFILFYKIEIS